MSKSAVLAAAGLVLMSGIGGAQNKQPNPPDSTRLIDSVQGPNLYKAYCAVCHGPNAKGDGPMAKSLKTAPSDLTRISTALDEVKVQGDRYPAHLASRVGK